MLSYFVNTNVPDDVWRDETQREWLESRLRAIAQEMQQIKDQASSAQNVMITLPADSWDLDRAIEQSLQEYLEPLRGDRTRQLIPPDMVVFYNGTIENAKKIKGWAVCDGTNGAPDYMGNFVKLGCDTDTTGGASTHTHTVTLDDPQHAHGFDADTDTAGANANICVCAASPCIQLCTGYACIDYTECSGPSATGFTALITCCKSVGDYTDGPSEWCTVDAGTDFDVASDCHCHTVQCACHCHEIGPNSHCHTIDLHRHTVTDAGHTHYGSMASHCHGTAQTNHVHALDDVETSSEPTGITVDTVSSASSEPQYITLIPMIRLGA